MTEQQLIPIKNQIIELGTMCYKINNTFRQLKDEIIEFEKSFTNLHTDLHQLKYDLNISEVF